MRGRGPGGRRRGGRRRRDRRISREDVALLRRRFLRRIDGCQLEIARVSVVGERQVVWNKISIHPILSLLPYARKEANVTNEFSHFSCLSMFQTLLLCERELYN